MTAHQSSLFISHGSPMFALEPGRLGANLAALGRTLSGMTAVLVVSPHWQTRGVRVATTPTPATLHDFGGFPAPLYQLQYPAPGAPQQAAQAALALQAAGFDVATDPQRGLDHGAWVPLRHLLPQADIPVFQVSMPHDLDVAGALRMGRALAGLRAQGVLLIGSGSLTHNLYEFGRPVGDPEYAEAFAEWVHKAVLAHDIAALVDYRRRAPHAVRAHPTEEHFLPLLVAIGASHATEPAQRIDEGMTDKVFSMDSFAFGLGVAID
jgi:4,5-DOPA dioxygenase extradiol